MFPKSAMGMSIGLGSMSIALHREMMTGPNSNMVDTLSRNAERRQSKSMSIHVSRHIFIPDASMSLTEQHSKTPATWRGARR